MTLDIARFTALVDGVNSKSLEEQNDVVGVERTELPQKPTAFLL